MSDGISVTDIQNGIRVASNVAVAAAPIVSMYNPAVGAAMTVLAPVASEFLITQTQVLVTIRDDMTAEEMKEALVKSKSANWDTPSLT